jgi:hypothetical protein
MSGRKESKDDRKRKHMLTLVAKLPSRSTVVKKNDAGKNGPLELTNCPLTTTGKQKFTTRTFTNALIFRNGDVRLYV